MIKVTVASALALLSGGAFAIPMFGLTESNSLVLFDSSDTGTYRFALPITGRVDGEALVGIDFRPSNGMLYGLGRNGGVYTIDTKTAVATRVSRLNVNPNLSLYTPSGLKFGLDFNPVPDRMRITSTERSNLRINVESGLTLIDGTLNIAGGAFPNVVASAYTNNFAGATSTMLYDLDAATNSLWLQSPPNSGTLTKVANLDIDIDDRTGFDIITEMDGTNKAFIVANPAGSTGSSLYRLNLTNGTTSFYGTFPGTDRMVGLAIAPR